MNIYLIEKKTEMWEYPSGAFWSNKDGWGDGVQDATVFTEAERYNLNLPPDGEWCRFRQVTTEDPKPVSVSGADVLATKE